MSVESIIAESPRFREVIRVARRVACSSANVLITGESGTGKEVIARMIHDMSTRQQHKFVAINCSAIPEQLLESELFGFARGAFTGAMAAKAGLFEEANGGTLFLDEVGDMDLHLQAKLLRVLQDKQIKRVGENHYRPLNIRILAATHCDLNEDILRKKFREDLYFRLNVVPIEIPPLRERREDILPLANYFLKHFSVKHQIHGKSLSRDALKFLNDHNWSGNVRELENVIERAVVLSSEQEISLRDLDCIEEYEGDVNATFQRLCQQEGRFLSLEEVSRNYIQYVLQANKGAREKTARDLGIDRKTLYRKTHCRIE
ncbi:MAG: sigma-54-dependent Fis family transcriptional regulator [Bdellovibrio sp.]|nr:sigma-54-dependent Fis family transcriptional regulator [Bdellovibrio sp.]